MSKENVEIVRETPAARPRLLLIPSVTELYWRIRPLLEEWAEVAAYDSPGVGSEPAPQGPLLDAIASRGLVEVENRGWTRYVVVADTQGGVAAIQLSRRAGARVAGLALGHARLSNRSHGPRAPLSAGVDAARGRMMEIDYRSSVRQELAIWDPRRTGGAESAPDELVDAIIDRLPSDRAIAYHRALDEEAEAAGDLEPALRRLALPLLLAKHEGCVSYTDEGFEDAVAAFPEAQTAVCAVRPTASAEFAAGLREFCQRVW
jgi:hypothetical protein